MSGAVRTSRLMGLFGAIAKGDQSTGGVQGRGHSLTSRLVAPRLSLSGAGGRTERNSRQAAAKEAGRHHKASPLGRRATSTLVDFRNRDARVTSRLVSSFAQWRATSTPVGDTATKGRVGCRALPNERITPAARAECRVVRRTAAPKRSRRLLGCPLRDVNLGRLIRCGPLQSGGPSASPARYPSRVPWS